MLLKKAIARKFLSSQIVGERYFHRLSSPVRYFAENPDKLFDKPTPGGLISNRTDRSLIDTPNSLTAQ